MSMQTLTLSCGAWAAEICPSFGGNITRLTYHGENVLRPLETEEQFERSPYVYGMPMLMPANRTKGGRFTFEGKRYTLPLTDPQNDCNLHGSIARACFDTVAHDACTAVLRLLNQGTSYYPFPFSLTVTYALSEKGLTADYAIENIGDRAMPFTFALHTTFTEPRDFSVPIDCCLEKDAHHIPTGRYVPLTSSEQAYVTGAPSNGCVISGYYRACGNTAKIGDYLYTVSEPFDHWVLFNGRGVCGYLCVEPQMGKVNGLNMEDGHRVLASGENITLKTEIMCSI